MLSVSKSSAHTPLSSSLSLYVCVCVFVCVCVCVCVCVQIGAEEEETEGVRLEEEATHTLKSARLSVMSGQQRIAEDRRRQLEGDNENLKSTCAQLERRTLVGIQWLPVVAVTTLITSCRLSMRTRRRHSRRH